MFTTQRAMWPRRTSTRVILRSGKVSTRILSNKSTVKLDFNQSDPSKQRPALNISFSLSKQHVMKKLLLLACVTFLLGTVLPSFGQTHAYIWDANNGPRDIGSLGSESYAYAINDSGTVVGYYLPLDPRFYAHGFIWTEATGMVDLGIP